MDGFRERFWERMCGFQSALYLLLVFDLAMLIVALLTLPFVRPASAAGVLIRIDVALFGIVLLPLAGVLYGCRRRNDTRY